MKYLDEVAADLRLGERMADPERFLVRQIKAGRIRARKIGRHWMMTAADVEHALDVFASQPRQPEPQPAAEVARIGLSAASARRRGITAVAQ